MALAVTRSNGIRVSSGGAADEIQVNHDGANATVTNSVGTLTVKNTGINKDIVFNVNDGGVDTEILRLVASSATLSKGAVDAFNIAFGLSSVIYRNTGTSLVQSNSTFSNTPTDGTAYSFFKYRGTQSFPLTAASGDWIFQILGYGYEGTATRPVSRLYSRIDTVTGADDISGIMVIQTRNDGAAAPLANRLTVGKQGNLTALAPYTTVIGGTNVALHIDNTGLIGPAPSSERFKENITAIDPADTEWILNVPVKSFNFKGSVEGQIGLIAEELEIVNPAAVRYDTYQVGEKDVLAKIDRGQFKFVKDESEIAKNVKVTENVKKTEIINQEEVETIVEMDVKRIAEGIHKDQVIFALLNEVKKLEARVAVLEGLVS